MASISKLNNGWQYRISYKDENGKFRTKNKGRFDTKKEAQLAAMEVERLVSRGLDVAKGDTLFPDYFEEWFVVFRKGKNSVKNDTDILKALKFAKENFADVKLKDLDRTTYQKALNDYAATRRTSTVQKIHIYLKASIKDAIEEGIIFKDPTYRVQAKGALPPKADVKKYLNYEEARKFADILKENLSPDKPAKYMILFALATGCRFAEVMGLTWNCVDFENKSVRINKTWDYVYTHTFSDTKNYQSKRVITIDPKTCSLLKELQTAQNEIMNHRQIKNTLNLVFLNSDFEFVSNSYVNRVVRETCKKIGSNVISFHGLRHTHGSILIYQGLNLKYVSKRLGHKKVKTTLEIYQHILDEMEQLENTKASEVIDNIL